ncbi:MAG TPA: hypothetical protein VHD63_23505 [Ktedonobacteraceae bacterium]|nr:hypothetical protein [Ktedonobacteraceae bacterium]
MPDHVGKQTHHPEEQQTENEKPTTEAQKQIYDNVIKRLIEGQFQKIIPLLFSSLEPVVLRELTIEALLPPRRMDRVYLVQTASGKAILHIEIEMAPRGRGKISRRILVYHSLLLEKYNHKEEDVPVITLVLYPFETPGGEPLLQETFGDEEILHFSYRELSLRTLNASTFIQARPIPLYGLLPAMGGITLEVLMTAIDDMIQYFEGDHERLVDELLCFKALLNRARPLAEAEMEQVLRRIRMYDPLLEEDPWVQEYGQRREAQGEAKGKTEGIRHSIEKILQLRFPELQEPVMERIRQVQDLSVLEQMLVTLIITQDDTLLKNYLKSLTLSGSRDGAGVKEDSHV